MKETNFNKGISLHEPSVRKNIYYNNVSEVIYELQKGKVWTYMSRKCTCCVYLMKINISIINRRNNKLLVTTTEVVTYLSTCLF
jgi:hypothetical protein